MKTRPVGAELIHADRWTDGQTDRQTDRHDECFRNFANAPNNRGHFQYDLWSLGC